MLQKIREFIKSLYETGYEEEAKRKYGIRKILREEKEGELERRLLEEGERNFRLMKKTPRPKGMKYYDDVIKGKRIKEIESFDGMVIGYFCNLVPEELIYASGALPVRLCSGFYDTINVSEELLPKDICPLIKSSFGFTVSNLPYSKFCNLIVIPTSCDGKKKLAEVLSNYLPVWTLDLPNTKSTKSKESWFVEVKILKKKIEKLTGAKITNKKLKESIELLHKRTQVFRRFYELRKKSVVTGSDALLVVQTSFYDDINRWIQKTEELCDELEENENKSDVRLLLTGSPIIWPNYKLLNIIEEHALIVVDELCSGTQHLYDPVVVDEYTTNGMLKAMAERYFSPSTCPCFTSSDDRIDRLLQMVDDFKVHGVIYYVLRLCQLYDLEAQKVRQILKGKRIPMIKIQTDYSQEDVEQIRTRIEAFLEMTKTKKKL